MQRLPHHPVFRLASALALALLLAAPAWAASFTVTSTADSNTSGTLRFALNHAVSGDTITIQASLGTITLTADLPAIVADLTIEGNLNTLDGGGSFRGFLVYAGTVSISDLTIQNAVAHGGNGGAGVGGGGGGAGLGGAIFVGSLAKLTTSKVIFTGNNAVGGNGGVPGAGLGAGGGMGGTGGTSVGSGFGGGGGAGVGANGGTGGSAGAAGIILNAAAGGAGDLTGGGGAGGIAGGGGGGGGDIGGGGGGVAGGAGQALAGGAGGFGGGGGSASTTGGAGGFGGGGGSASTTGGAGGYGGGGGAGATDGTGGFGGGAGAAGNGGGGAGLGGALFVQAGGGLTLDGTLTISGNGTTAGAGGSNGSAFGPGVFLQGKAAITFAPAATETQTVSDPISDEAGSDPGVTALSGGVVMSGAGTLVLSGSNTYSGPTAVEAGILRVNGSLAAGSAVTVSSGAWLAGSGTINGPVTFSPGSRFFPPLAITGAVTPATTTTTLTPATATGSPGQSVTITVAVASGAVPVVDGTVSVTDTTTGVVLGSLLALQPNGNATVTLSAPAEGVHTIVATYNPDLAHATSSATLPFSVGAPVITLQPVSQTVTAGSIVTFTVAAIASQTVTYQWLFNGAAIDGATSATLTLDDASSAQEGTYEVIAITPAAAVFSSVVTLAVQPATFLGTVGTQGTFALNIDSDGTAVLLVDLPGTETGYVANLAVGPGGNLTATSTQFPGGAAGPTFTVVVGNGTVTGTSSAPNLAFQGLAVAGTAAAGFYPAASGAEPLDFIVGANAQIFALVGDGGAADNGTGTLLPDGSFSLVTNSGDSIAGMIDAATGRIAGTTDTGGVIGSFEGLSDTVPVDDTFVDLSARVSVGTGAAVAVAGFIVEGTSPMQVLVRAAGPALANFGVSGSLAQPVLSLFSGTTEIAQNQGWSTASNAGAVAATAAAAGAFPYSPGSADSAVLVTLQPGAYSAVVSGAKGGTGISLVEVYPVAGSSSVVANVSVRGTVGTGADVLIVGMVISGNGPKQVLVRAVGPTLSEFGVTGVLASPQVQVYQGSSLIASNSGWNGSSAVLSADAESGAFPLLAGSADAAMVVTLYPGSYTLVASGVKGTSGAALVEAYELP